MLRKLFWFDKVMLGHLPGLVALVLGGPIAAVISVAFLFKLVQSEADTILR